MASLPVDLSALPLLVRTDALAKGYSGRAALSSLDLHIPTGAIYLFVGPNGAGKTTTIKLLLDQLTPSSGTASVFGLDPVRHGALIRANVGYVPEQLVWGYHWMSVGHQLRHHADYFPSWDWQYAHALCKLFDIDLQRRMGTLSKGQGRRVHLVLALSHRPPLLVLDEPTDGFDPLMREEALGVLAAHVSSSPTTVLISTHHVSEFESLATHIGVLREGRLCLQAALRELRFALHNYRAMVTSGWTFEDALPVGHLLGTRTAEGMSVTCWGDPVEVTSALEASGATQVVHSPVSLHDAVLMLLRGQPRVVHGQ